MPYALCRHPRPSNGADQESGRRAAGLLHDSLAKQLGEEGSRLAVARDWSLVEWGREYLPNHFRLPPSRMHVWIAEQLEAFKAERGRKLNVLGPRGGAKSTIGTLAFVLRAALEAREPYIMDRFGHQASGRRPSGEHQDRTA